MSNPALVQRIPFPSETYVERRGRQRFLVSGEAVSRPLDAPDAVAWGAQIRDLSATGIGLTLCYPFKPGTYLVIDLQEPIGDVRTVLGRVVHVYDRADGTWTVGCEFVQPLSDEDVEAAARR